MVLFYLKQMLLPAVAAAILYGIIFPLRAVFLRKKTLKTTVSHEILLLCFVMFLAGLARLTLTPWSSELKNGVNLIPFTVFWQTAFFLRHGNYSYLLINVVGNIVMFWPIGFMPAVLWKKPRWWKAFLFGFVCSVSIELSQLRIQRGTDVDDVWMNTLGASMGYWLYLVVHSGIPKFSEAAKIRQMTTPED